MAAPSPACARSAARVEGRRTGNLLLPKKPLTGACANRARSRAAVGANVTRQPCRALLLNDASIRARAVRAVGRRAAAAARRPRRRRASYSSRSLAAAEMGGSPITAYRERRASGAAVAEGQTFTAVAGELEDLYESLRRRRRAPRRDSADPLATREWIVVDLHMHTDASHDCQVPPALLLDQAEAEGLGAVAITDHNVFAGAVKALELARNRDVTVIPGEEVKTDNQGEVIGLFLHEEIPRGMPFADTVAAIKEQDGLVYVPHPFDRMHAIPDAATLPSPGDIDVSGYNPPAALRDVQRRVLRSRASTTCDGRGPGRPRPAGARHRGCACAGSDPEEFLVRPSSPAVAQVGGAGKGTGSIGKNSGQSRARADRRDRRALPSEGDHREQRARARNRRRRGRGLPRRRFGTSTRGRLPAQVRAAGRGGAGGRRLLRTRRAGSAEVAPAPAGRPDGDLRHELPQVRRPEGRAGARVSHARAAYRPAEADRGHGRGHASLSHRARLSAVGHPRVEPWRRAKVHAHDRRAGRSRHRRVPRRATVETEFWNAFKALGWWVELPPC